MDNSYMIRKEISTGNPLKDILISGVAGLGEGLNPRGKYYVQSNWRGNGLANTGIGYLANPNYRDWASGAAAASALWKNGKFGDNILARLSGLGNFNKRRELYRSVSDAIDKYARPTQYDMYSDNYGYTDNNFSSPISRGITDYFNGTPDSNSIQGVVYNQRPKVSPSIWNDYLR